jgi:DNA-binding transcriptional LysR family regulator
MNHSTIDWGLIPAFLAVMQEGSLSAAGRRLGRSQPTVGRQLEALEAQLGVTLFHRSPRGLIPTETAHALAGHAESMEHAAAALSLAATGRAQRIAGTVRVTASEVVATYILPGIIAPLLDAEPALEIELVATNTTDNLLLREADIAVRMVAPTQPELIARRIGELEMGLFASETYLAQHGEPHGPEDLGDHRVLGYDRSDLIIRAMGTMGIEARRSDFRFRIDDQVAYTEAIVAGVGIGGGQVHLLARREGVRRVLPELPLPALPVWLVAHRELRSAARVRRVYDHLAAGLAAVVS